MLVAGIDVGAATAKTVILGDGEILAYAISPTGHDVKFATNKVITEALEKAGLSTSTNSLDYVVSTGYARESIDFADKTVTEIICHAKGSHYVLPSTRFIIDMGGQDSKAIEVDPQGNVINFVMNDKCAAGTGRFLEVMAQVLEVGSISEMGPIALKSVEPCHISSTCTVFAETEVVVLRAEGKHRNDLIAGVHKAAASRVAVMSSSLTFRADAVFTGGVAKNVGIKKFLEEEIGMELLVPDEPQIIGALGAALFAQTELVKQR
ncbi:MAG: 2-hydroxyglutaryl-CoA dehydratase [Deltaproteobacteria bacterium]|nr:MAG: 2-hydroxyglutaryl-CoA dehydratase [Deltaproteobacteria bacterium]